MENNREIYLTQLTVAMAELKKLKQIKGINGDMDLLDEFRQANDLLTDLSYDWSIGIDAIFKIWGYYILHADISTEQKENDWNIITTFLKVLGQLHSHSNYIRTNLVFFEELTIAIDHEEITV